MDPVLKVRDVCLSYHTLSGETPALSHISFDLMPGEFLSVVGPSGCGKSTLLNLIAGLIEPECGSIILDGKAVCGNSSTVGYMLQKDHLWNGAASTKTFSWAWRSGDNLPLINLPTQKNFFTPTALTGSGIPDLLSFPAVCASALH